MKNFLFFCAAILGLLVVNNLRAQSTVTLPRASQKSVVSQRIGITDVTITSKKAPAEQRSRIEEAMKRLEK